MRSNMARKAPQHGSLRMYILGCRCEPCRAKKSEALKRERERLAQRTIWSLVSEQWHKDAGCPTDRSGLPPEAWDVHSHLSEQAKRVCLTSCPVIDDCRMWAAKNRPTQQIYAGRRWYSNRSNGPGDDCSVGHPMVAANLSIDKHGRRKCLQCTRDLFSRLLPAPAVAA